MSIGTCRGPFSHRFILAGGDKVIPLLLSLSLSTSFFFRCCWLFLENVSTVKVLAFLTFFICEMGCLSLVFREKSSEQGLENGHHL